MGRTLKDRHDTDAETAARIYLARTGDPAFLARYDQTHASERDQTANRALTAFGRMGHSAIGDRS